MAAFEFHDGLLHAERVAITDIVAAVGTPAYVYSRAHLLGQYHALETALAGVGARICYAVKANSNLAILRLFEALGAGFDIVSGGELQRVLAAGAAPASVVFSGVGKSTAEIDLALKHGIGCFNVESESELDRIARRAELLSRRARVAVRVNPDVDAATHPYISTGLKTNKFGVPIAVAPRLFERAGASRWLDPVGIACHIGSQITRPEPLLEAAQSLIALHARLAERGFSIEHLDLGGGFGVSYRDEPEFDLARYGRSLAELLRPARAQDPALEVVVEPGRFLVANGGLLVTTVEHLKPATVEGGRNFAVVDAAMNDLIRPALYQAWHRVENVRAGGAAEVQRWDVVGPVCESADYLALDRPLSLAAGDLLAIGSAGAYGMVQASNYNSRARPVEVLVDGDGFRVIRRRETTDDLMRLEQV